MCLKCWKCIFSQSQDTNFQNFLGEHAPRVLDPTKFAGLLTGGQMLEFQSHKCQVNSFPYRGAYTLFNEKFFYEQLALNFSPSYNRNTVGHCSHNNGEQKKNHKTFSTEHEAQA